MAIASTHSITIDDSRDARHPPDAPARGQTRKTFNWGIENEASPGASEKFEAYVAPLAAHRALAAPVPTCSAAVPHELDPRPEAPPRVSRVCRRPPRFPRLRGPVVGSTLLPLLRCRSPPRFPRLRPAAPLTATRKLCKSSSCQRKESPPNCGVTAPGRAREQAHDTSSCLIDRPLKSAS